jgi:hypothetical protein
MPSECQEIKKLFEELVNSEPHPFPSYRKSVKEPVEQGVYIIRGKIRRKKKVLHVGRTYDGKGGLCRRLNDHRRGQSSFVQHSWWLKGDGWKLYENGYTYQYLIETNDRKRALLEAYATGKLCPEYVGLGKKKSKKSKTNKSAKQK